MLQDYYDRLSVSLTLIVNELPVRETRMVLSNCYATIGVVSNSDHCIL